MPNANYDDELLVDLLSGGGLTYAQIAEKVGLSMSMVGKIARGQCRTNLHTRVQRRLTERKDMMANLEMSWGPTLMRKHIQEGITATGETARKCREYMLNRIALRRPEMKLPEVAFPSVLYEGPAEGIESRDGLVDALVEQLQPDDVREDRPT